MQKIKTTAVLFLLVMQLLLPVSLAASPVPASLYIPDTTLDVSGIAAPGALVQVYDGSALIGSMAANSNGIFSKHFPAMETGLHPLRIVYTDEQGLLSTEVKDTVNIQSQQNTSLEYFLPPTLSIAPETVNAGDFVSISGSTAPNAIVEILVDGGGQTLRPQADSSGSYSIALDTDNYYSGIHIARAHAALNQDLSHPTRVYDFKVDAGEGSTQKPGGSLAAPIIGGPSLLETDTSPVTISGTAEPGAQVVIFVDDTIVGSTFANSEGSWSIALVPRLSYHRIDAIACIGGDCSPRSNLIELMFTGDLLLGGQPALCPAGFTLSKYRFWNIAKDESISVSTMDLRGSQPYEWVVDWGDGTLERFNQHDGSLTNLHHIYSEAGQFNASITMVDDEGCIHQRYFSVDVRDNPLDWRWMLFSVPLLMILLGGLIIRQHRLDNRKAAATVR